MTGAQPSMPADPPEFPARTAELLRAAGRTRRWPAGAVLIQQGAAPDSVIWLLTGLVKITAASGLGHTALLAVRGAGDLVGELSCLDGTPRATSATAMQPVDGVVIGATAFDGLLHRHPELAMAVLRSVVSRLRDSDVRRADYGALSSQGRVARVLLDLAARHGTPAAEPRGAVRVRMTQQELGDSAGASRESTVRCLRAMHAAQVIRTGRGQLLVTDVAGLRRWAER